MNDKKKNLKIKENKNAYFLELVVPFGFFTQSISHLNRSQLIQPIGGVFARLLMLAVDDDIIIIIIIIIFVIIIVLIIIVLIVIVIVNFFPFLRFFFVFFV